MIAAIEITNNEKNLHFETDLGDNIAYIEYRWLKGNLVLMHTVVPEAHEGKGIAGSLAKFALDYAREKNLHLIVYCPYVAVYMKRHPEYNDLLLKSEG
jgi:hypothetical protein